MKCLAVTDDGNSILASIETPDTVILEARVAVTLNGVPNVYRVRSAPCESTREAVAELLEVARGISALAGEYFDQLTMPGGRE